MHLRGLGSVLKAHGLAILWAAVPFTAGPALAAGLEGSEQTFGAAASVVLWGTWALTLLAALVPRPSTLTAVRIVMPALLAAGVWATSSTPSPGWRDVLCLATGALLAVVPLTSAVGDRFIDGASYGDERRFGLRPPGPLLLGPIEIAWIAVVAGVLAGPIALAHQHWWLGLALTLLGWPTAAVAVRALHSLALRCVVFVPAGFVVVDPSTLADPVLVPRQLVSRVSVGTAADLEGPVDIRAGAPGLAVAVQLDEPQPVALAARRRSGPPEPLKAPGIVLSPSRPGRFLAEAAGRGFPVS